MRKIIESTLISADGVVGGLVDCPALLDVMRADGYSGWLVFESEQTPNPARSAMLNGWYARQVLRL